MTDKVDEAALRAEYSCGMPRNDNPIRDPFQVYVENLLSSLSRPVNTNPATYKARGEDL